MTERGPLQVFEITWKDGRTEILRAHQVSYPHVMDLASPRAVAFHGEFDGQWTLVLRALSEDIRTIRNHSIMDPEPNDAIADALVSEALVWHIENWVPLGFVVGKDPYANVTEAARAILHEVLDTLHRADVL